MVVVVAVLTAGRGSAQDMVFEVDRGGPDPQYDAGGAPSETLAAALGKYDRALYDEAAVLLQRVVEGSTKDGPGRVEQAQFFLAKALLRLGFLHSALGAIDETTLQPSGHRYRAQSLPWLLELAQRMPDPAPVLPVLDRYVLAELEQTSATLQPQAAAELWLLAGRAALASGELDVALERLGRVTHDTPAYPQAQFLSGIAHVKQRRARPAIAAFRRMIDASDDAGEAAARLHALGWLSLGRVYYTAAFGADEQSEGALLGNAVEAWSQVDTTSADWLDALFESAWALFVTDEHARALGNLHALLSPFFTGAFYPEAHVLKSVIFFDSCQMSNASAALATFHAQYDPVRDQLGALTGGKLDSDAALKLLDSINAGTSDLSPQVRTVLARALGDRELARARAGLAALDEEQRALEAAPPALRSSTLAERIAQDLAVERSVRREQLGERVRARLDRLLAELQEVENQADTIEIEILGYQRGELGVPPATPPSSGSSVHVDSEHVLWPFNGEYWRDELGFYRQQLTNHCRPR
jgi:tetratricopeptide (TPR) repeat protein